MLLPLYPLLREVYALKSCFKDPFSRLSCVSCDRSDLVNQSTDNNVTPFVSKIVVTTISNSFEKCSENLLNDLLIYNHFTNKPDLIDGDHDSSHDLINILCVSHF